MSFRVALALAIAVAFVRRGRRGRETYVVRGADEFEEIFEFAESGKPFEVYSRSRLKRTK